MNAMNAERYYRLIARREILERIESDMAEIQSDMLDGPEKDRLISASWHLARAIRLIDVPAPEPAQQQSLTERLEASIARVRAEKERCGEIEAFKNKTIRALH